MAFPRLQNSKGQIYYGMHFYPGVAEYAEPKKEPYRVFLNEDTLRGMDPTFAGRPLYVDHVDEVEGRVDDVRKDADGWVVESFFNAADGKHWVKFITVTERAEKAVRNGYRLSNAYIPKSFSGGGLWNGVSYTKEITSGEFEHLALVQNPRYEESVVLTPDEFKSYNERLLVELKKLANSSPQPIGEEKMKFEFFKRAKVENALDPELIVVLPKSKKEIRVVKLVNWADEHEEKKNDAMADPAHQVKLHDGTMTSVADLVEKHKQLHDELAALKKDAVPPEEKEPKPEAEKENGDDEEAEKKALELAEHEEKEIEAAKKKNAADAAAKTADLDAKRKAAKEKADKLRNAGPHVDADMEQGRAETSFEQVARGKARYGS